MQYRIPCECGDEVIVAEAAAGSKIPCSCGRTIVVPSLRELRQLAGMPARAPSPEMVIETLLLAGKLPEEDDCVLCGVATDQSICCQVECEKAHVKTSRPPWWVWVLGSLTFGWYGIGFVRVAGQYEKTETEWGKDRIFPLPLRVCEACKGQLTTPSALRDALERVVLYRRLLYKYPAATITLLDSHH
jgi:hypothetical protein